MYEKLFARKCLKIFNFRRLAPGRKIRNLPYFILYFSINMGGIIHSVPSSWQKSGLTHPVSFTPPGHIMSPGAQTVGQKAGQGSPFRSMGPLKGIQISGKGQPFMSMLPAQTISSGPQGAGQVKGQPIVSILGWQVSGPMHPAKSMMPGHII